MSGSLTISMEVELGWWTHDRGEYEYFSPDGEKEGIRDDNTILVRFLD